MLVKELLLGYYDTQCLFDVNQLGIADHLHSGAKSIKDLAQFFNTESIYIPKIDNEYPFTLSDSSKAKKVLNWESNRHIKDYIQGIIK